MNIPTSSHPAAYLRRSYVDPNSPGDISREAQRETIHRLAHAEGHNGDLVEYDDWGVSADVAKAAKRTAYARLLAGMEAGIVSAVYAFDVDRLYRDPRDLIRLQDAAQRHRVRIVTTSGSLAIGDGDDPGAEGFAFMGAVFGRMELQKAKKRSRAAREARRARGDVFGHPPYGYQRARDDTGRISWVPDPSRPLQPVLDAFNEAGSFNGAARLLNARKVPPQRGEHWAGNIVNKIIRRERPGLVPKGRSQARVAPRGSQRLSRLLHCHCGRTLTPRVNYTVTPYGRYGPYISYQCYDGRHNPDHGKPYMIAENAILDWVKAEADRLAPDVDAVQMGEQDAAQRDALEGQRERLGWAVTDGLLTREQAQARAAEIDAAIGKLGDRAEVIEVPAIQWDAPPDKVNAILRALWEYVQLGPDMRPTEAVWRVPEWRA